MSENILSNVELAILSILNTPTVDNDVRVGSSYKTIERSYMVNELPLKRLSRYITASMTPETDEDYRLFTTDIQSVMSLPTCNFGIVMIDNRYVKESTFNRLQKIPRGYTTGSFDSVWQFDFVYTSINTLKSELIQTVFAVKDRTIIPLYPFKTPRQIILRMRSKHIRESTEHFALCTSIMEDYALKQFWHLDITDGVTISTYSKEADIKSFLDIRDSPLTQMGQRKRVLHWVSGHRRSYSSGKTVEIERHLRGLEHFRIGGFDIDITQPHK